MKKLKYFVENERLVFEDESFGIEVANVIMAVCIKWTVPRDIKATQANAEKISAEVNEFAKDLGVEATCRAVCQGAGILLRWRMNDDKPVNSSTH